MTTGDILYYDLLGVILVFTADVFHLWEPWAAAITLAIDRVKATLATARRR